MHRKYAVTGKVRKRDPGSFYRLVVVGNNI